MRRGLSALALLLVLAPVSASFAHAADDTPAPAPRSSVRRVIRRPATPPAIVPSATRPQPLRGAVSSAPPARSTNPQAPLRVSRSSGGWVHAAPDAPTTRVVWSRPEAADAPVESPVLPSAVPSSYVEPSPARPPVASLPPPTARGPTAAGTAADVSRHNAPATHPVRTPLPVFRSRFPVSPRGTLPCDT